MNTSSRKTWMKQKMGAHCCGHRILNDDHDDHTEADVMRENWAVEPNHNAPHWHQSGVAHSLHFTEQQNMVHITTTRRSTLFNRNFCWVVGSCLCSAISIRCQIVSLIQRWNQKPHDNDCADVVLCSNLFPPVFHTPWNLFNFNIDRQWHKDFHKDKCMPYKLGGGLYPGRMRLGLAWECGSRGSNQDIERCLGWELRSRFSGAGAQCGKSGDDDE